MEKIFNDIKDFILTTVNPYISEMADSETPMNEINEKNIVFGSVDLSRYNAKVICSIIPDSQEENEEEIGSYKITSDFTVTFLCKGYPLETLVRQMCRYGAAFRRAVLDDVSLGGKVERSEIGRREFFTDAGTVEKQVTAVEIGLTTETEDEIEL